MLELQFIPYNQISGLNSEERIKKLLKLVTKEKIVLLEGRLQEEEETELIRKTMEMIDEKFTGIELGVIHPEEKDLQWYQQLHKLVIRLLLGHRDGFTVIGPANIIKEIKKDPEKIQLFMKEEPKKRKKK